MLTKPSIKVATHSVSNTSSDASPVVTDDEIDVMIRTAFQEFSDWWRNDWLYRESPDHYRLFPRPVVALKSSVFFEAIIL